MIPKFLTTKPTTNRNTSEVPVGPESNSSDQLPNQDTFQKTLQERTEPRNSATVNTRSESVTGEVRPEPTSPKTPRDNTNATDEKIGSSKAQLIATEERQNQIGIELADSDSTGNSDGASDRITQRDSAGNSREARSDRQESTGIIRRIDPENHSAADDVPVSSPLDIPVPNGNPRGAASAVQAELLSIEDTDPGTLPSLIRHSLEDVSVNNFSGEVIPENNNVEQVVGTQSHAGSPETPNKIDINGELRPFLNDALVPDSKTGGVPTEISAIDSSLVETVTPNRPQADIYNQASVDELLPIPPLPSLRSDAATTVPLVLKVSAPNNFDTQADGEIQKVARPAQSAEELSESPVVNASAFDSLLTENNPEVTRPQSEIIEQSVSEQSSEEPPQILPSLIAAHPRLVERMATEEQQEVGQTLGKIRTDRRTSLQINDVTAEPTLSIAPRDTVTEQRPTDVVTVPDKSLAPADDSDVTDEPPVAVDRSAHRGNSRVHDQTFRETSIGKSLNEGQSVEHFPRELDLKTSDQTTTEVQRDFKQVPAERRIPASQETARDNENPTPKFSENPADHSKLNTVVRAKRRGFESAGDLAVRDKTKTPRVENSTIPERPVKEIPNEAASQQPGNPIAGDAQVHPTHHSAAQTNENVARQTEGTIDRTRYTQASETNGRAVPVTAEYSATTENLESIVRPGTKQQVENIEPIAPDVPKNNRQTEQNPNADPPHSPAALNSHWISSENSQQPPTVDLPNNPAAASPAATIDVGAVATSIDPELSSNNASASSHIQTPVASTNQGTSTTSVRQDVVREPAVPMDIQDAVSAIQEATSGDSHIRVRLNPRQLGNLLVDVSRTDNGVVARLEVESAAARVAVLETLPDLQQSLSRSGTSVDRIEVVLTETRAESGRQESGQSHQGEQQPWEERQSENQQQARDEQNQRRKQNQHRDQQDDSSQTQEESTDEDASEQLDIKL